MEERVRQAFATIVFSRFGERMALAAGLEPMYVPHGVDTAVFHPIERDAARRSLGLPVDRFLVGMVAANHDRPSRKSLPQALEAFSRFVRRHRDALLYLHTARGDEPWSHGQGVELNALIHSFGLEKHVTFANAYDLLMGCPDEHMARTYSALDLLLAPSLGEGFGVPIVEAQACGCPVLVGDWTSMGELCFAGHRIPRDRSEPYWTSLRSFQRVPHVAAIEDGLEAMHERRADPELRSLARAGAQAYDADLVTRTWWQAALTALTERLAQASPSCRRTALILRQLAEAPPGPVVGVGCLRTPREVPAHRFSTLHLARASAEQGRSFSVWDSDSDIVDTANRVLVREGLAPVVACRETVAALRESPPLAFLHLGSSDDPESTLQQFVAAALLPGAIVVVEECQPTAGFAHGRATALVPDLVKDGVPLQFVATDPGQLALVVTMESGKPTGALRHPRPEMFEAHPMAAGRDQGPPACVPLAAVRQRLDFKEAK